MIRAALLAFPPPRAISAAAQEALERLEREASELLRVVLDTLGPGGANGTRIFRGGRDA